jgi:MFS family permease
MSGHAQAIAGQTMAFLVIDRLATSPATAQPLIGTVLMCGAGAALLAQWGLIPRLRLQPPSMVLWGSVMVMIGAVGCAFARDLHTLAIVFAIASLGFGFLRPGFTAGASLAVTEAEQGLVAGQVTSNNGMSFVLGPSIGIGLYQFDQRLPYLLCAAVMAALIPYILRTVYRR